MNHFQLNLSLIKVSKINQENDENLEIKVHDYFVLHFLPSIYYPGKWLRCMIFISHDSSSLIVSDLSFSLFFVFISNGVACFFPAFVVKLTTAQAFIVRNHFLKVSFAFCLMVKIICPKCYKHSKEAAQQSHLGT